jgi:hypothetical protein
MTDWSSHRALLPGPKSLARGGADREVGRTTAFASSAPLGAELAAQEDKIG